MSWDALAKEPQLIPQGAREQSSGTGKGAAPCGEGHFLREGEEDTSIYAFLPAARETDTPS